jgi:outer membrane receptor protein involved in Fe transport
VTAATQIIDVDDVSGQVGAAYLPRPWFSVYGSYSQSFAPNLAIAADGSTFGPKTADQYEGGVKTDAWGGRLTATAAVFRLTYEGNLSFVRDPATGAFNTVQGGVQRSSGFELDVTARPAAGLTIVGAVGTLNGRVVTDPVYLPGRVLGGAPDRRANLWVAWEMERGIGVGGGVFYQSAFKEFTSSDFFLPAFTTVEAMASYRLSPRATVRVHGKNLTDERYYLSGAGGFVAYPAPPRHVTASFVVRF